MTSPGDQDIEYSTRVLDIAAAWTFVMEKLDGLDMHTIEMKSQWWRKDECEEWLDTILVKVSGRVKEKAA